MSALPLRRNSVAWCPSFRRNFQDWEIPDLADLLELLSLQPLNLLKEDSWYWTWSTDGLFSVKSFATHLIMSASEDMLASRIWKPTSPSKINALVWAADLDRCLTKAHLCKRGVHIQDQSCVLCGQGLEDNSHLFLHCSISARIWNHFLGSVGLAWSMPASVKEMLWSWGLQGLSRLASAVWMYIPAAVISTIWAERNKRLFQIIYKDPEDLISISFGKLISWVSASKGNQAAQLGARLNSRSLWHQ
ncbi:PREDICTED: uncharacterized protein LOC104599835 [Nelumbo nucifera]|uniref:Uncharacterized protein LOC104599835 n=1 Tax=Nelumbo nucifera TaxID=4432 RepID=A0A1U8AEW8_NELNU|nr:PREDICTED: uncharacterized protein LOC104599835 [Nelumbo nucifera]